MRDGSADRVDRGVTDHEIEIGAVRPEWVESRRPDFSRVLARGRKARLADTLIAQSCLDHDAELVTRDTDFRHFAGAIGLKLFPGGARR